MLVRGPARGTTYVVIVGKYVATATQGCRGGWVGELGLEDGAVESSNCAIEIAPMRGITPASRPALISRAHPCGDLVGAARAGSTSVFVRYRRAAANVVQAIYRVEDQGHVAHSKRRPRVGGFWVCCCSGRFWFSLFTQFKE